MKTIRRICAVALSGVVVAAMLAAMPSASADSPESFAGSASAWALNAQVLNLASLKAGASNATGDSTPKAHANGSGLTGLLNVGITNADALTPNTNTAPPQACLLNVPVQGVLTLGAACSTSSASTMGGGPNAVSTASVVGLDVGVLQILLNLLKPVIDLVTNTVDPVISTVTTTLHPILGSLLDPLLTSLGIDQTKPVSSLITRLESLTTLASVAVLPSTSSVVSTAGAVTATADSQGASITVLPGLTVVLHNPLLSIKVLDAHATATYDRNLGTSTATITPAIVTVHLLDDTLPGFPLTVGLGTPITLLAGTPLESTISLGAGTTTRSADGTSASGTADGLSIHLLTGIMGGINIDLAHAEAAVTGSKAIVSPTTTTTAAPPTTAPPVHTGKLLLATTGSDLPFLPIGFFLILAGYLTHRRLARR